MQVLKHDCESKYLLGMVLAVVASAFRLFLQGCRYRVPRADRVCFFDGRCWSRGGRAVGKFPCYSGEHGLARPVTARQASFFCDPFLDAHLRCCVCAVRSTSLRCNVIKRNQPIFLSPFRLAQFEFSCNAGISGKYLKP